MKAGRSTREMEWKRYRLRIGLGLLTILLLWGCTFLLQGKSTIAGAIGVLILVKVIDGVGNAAIRKVRKREKDAGRGAAAEEKVGDILDALDKNRFQVFHDLASKCGNMDHMVLRRDGAVFVIETKSHGGQITWDGTQLLRAGKPLEKDFIKQTLGNVMGFREHLMGYAEQDLRVNGILCFTRGFVKVRNPIKGIQVIPSRWLAENLEKGKGHAALADWLWEHMATLVTLPRKETAPGPDAL